MPKRSKTPPPPDDEPKFLTVVFPYPAHVDVEKVEEQKALSRWIACCIGTDALLAFYHKPASPTMIIIEVLRSFKQWGSLLGLHKWSEFLKNPTNAEKQYETKIFYCVLSSGRQVQKHGWRRVDVKEAWFTRWDRENDPRIKHPYPPTSYCGTPPDPDKTNKSLCRPLPVADFPPPSAAPLPPVGTPQWQAVRTQNVSAKPEKGRGAARNKGAPQPSAPGPLSRSATAPVPSPPTRATSAWSNGPPGLTPSPGLQASSSLSTPSTSSSDFPVTPPGLSPGPNDGWHTSTLGENGAQPLHHQFAGLDIEDDEEDDDEWATQVQEVREIRPIQEEPEVNLWADYQQDQGDPVVPADTIVCPHHGPYRHCKKGICAEWKALDAERKRAERQAQREQEKAERKKKKEEENADGEDGKDNGRSNTNVKFKIVRRALPPDAVSTQPRATPPHLESVVEAAPEPEQAAPIPPPTNRPARGRRMNAAGTKPTSPPIATSSGANANGGQSKASGSASGWPTNLYTPWDSTSSLKGPSSAKKVPPPPSSNGGWGSVVYKSDPWGKSSVRGAPSVVSSNNGGWGKVSDYGNWGQPTNNSNSKKVPSVAEEIEVGEDASTWASKQPAGKSWADQVDDELGSQLGDHKEDVKSVAASSTSGWGHPPSLW
ncbi:hypothetical protein QCA50_005362 [Cerrena zonata]|uniref:Uncharacterized protein n=1 Tax=Cerrena zonata TaxID=2478898 RepID=A0AAW0GH19_9APHY